MPEMGTSGLTSGDGKRDGLYARTRACPRLYRRARFLAGLGTDLRIWLRLGCWVGQTIGLGRLLPWAFGPRNFMKKRQSDTMGQ
jgi:hypothetical protein